MESKFEFLICTETQKTLFAAHQLRGAVTSWWATYLAMQPTGRQVPWTEFSAAFRAYHIPPSMMKIKLREFLNLKQGSKTVREYGSVPCRCSTRSESLHTACSHASCRAGEGPSSLELGGWRKRRRSNRSLSALSSVSSYRRSVIPSSLLKLN